MNNKAKNECPTCDGNKRKPREKHCKLGMCVMTHEGITCSPDGVDCIHYIPSEPCPDCQSQEPETDTSEFVEECRFNLSENAGSVTSYKHRNIERLLKEACDRLEAAKTQIRDWQKRAMTEKSNVIYWKAKLKAAEKRISLKLYQTVCDRLETAEKRLRAMWAGDLSPESRLSGYKVITGSLRVRRDELLAKLKAETKRADEAEKIIHIQQSLTYCTPHKTLYLRNMPCPFCMAEEVKQLKQQIAEQQ